MNPKSEKIAHGKTRLSLLWLRLLVNLSFSTEGQQMIVKLPGAHINTMTIGLGDA